MVNTDRRWGGHPLDIYGGTLARVLWCVLFLLRLRHKVRLIIVAIQAKTFFLPPAMDVRRPH
jgi:hypothetical protein